MFIVQSINDFDYELSVKFSQNSTRGIFLCFWDTLRAAAASSWVAVRRLMPLTLSI